MADQVSRIRPDDFQFFCCTDGGPFVARYHGQKILNPDDFDIGQCSDCSVVNGGDTGTDRLGPYHACMQHPVNFDIMHVGVLPGDLGCNIRARQRLADKAIRSRIFQRGFLVNFQGKWLAAEQGRKSQTLFRIICNHMAIVHRQFCAGFSPLLCRHTDQCFACCRSRLTDLHAAAHDPRTASCRSLIRGQSGIAFNQGDRFKREAKLFGSHLRNSNTQACSQVDLAAIDGGGAIGGKRNEAIDLIGFE